MKSNLKEINETSLVIRLERNQLNLLQMKSNLTSYTCEPRTPNLFVRCESLKNKLDKINTTHSETIQAVKGHKKNVHIQLDKVKQQFQEFRQIKQTVEDYIAVARNH